jgi:pimeloyl-ACP methyl ester carboxylesterase
MTASATERERILKVGPLELFVRERGAGPPVLLVNGLGSNADMWGTVEEGLAGIARTIVFDLPGSGRSPTPPLPLSIPSLAAVVASLLEELDHGYVDVLGFSLGGIVAQQFAHDFPDRVRRLALVATGCGLGSAPPTVEALALLSMPHRYHSQAMYQQTNRLLGAADRAVLARVATISEARLRYPPPLLGYAYQLAAGSVWSSLAWLTSLCVPTLVLSGVGDQIVPIASGYQLAGMLPVSRLHVLDGGHLSLFDPEGPATGLLEDFFSSAELADSGAWATGASIADDAGLEQALAVSPGAFSHRVFSAAYRRLVRPPTGTEPE